MFWFSSDEVFRCPSVWGLGFRVSVASGHGFQGLLILDEIGF